MTTSNSESFMRSVVEAVYSYNGVKNDKKKTRKAEVVRAKALVSYFYKQYRDRANLSSSSVGAEIGIDHATVLHHAKKVAFQADRYTDTRATVQRLGRKVEDLFLSFYGDDQEDTIFNTEK